MDKYFYNYNLVRAAKIVKKEYFKIRDWDWCPADSEDQIGYVIEYMETKRKNDKNFEHYVTWIPEDVFCKRSISIDLLLEELKEVALVQAKELHANALDNVKHKDIGKLWNTFYSIIEESAQCQIYYIQAMIKLLEEKVKL